MNALKWSSWTELEKSLKSKGAHKMKKRKYTRELRHSVVRRAWEDLLSSMMEPANDDFLLVVCEKCQKLVCPSVQILHTNLCSSQHANTVAEETQVPGKGKAPNKKAKDYCPDSHCGVWIDKEDRHCVKSLTCKDHTLSERRQVIGRAKPFDELLKLHQEKMRKKGKPSKTTLSSQNTDARDIVPEEDKSLEHSLLGNWPSSDEEMEDLPSCGSSPATFTTFGLQMTSAHGVLSHHRGNPLLSAARALIGPLSTSGSVSQARLTTEHRKHLYSSLPEDDPPADKFYVPRSCVHVIASQPHLPNPVKPVDSVSTASDGSFPVNIPTQERERPTRLFPLRRSPRLMDTCLEKDNTGAPFTHSNLTEGPVSAVDTAPTTSCMASTTSIMASTTSIMASTTSNTTAEQLDLESPLNFTQGNSWLSHGTEHAQTSNANGNDLGSTSAGEESRHSVYSHFELAGEYPGSIGTVMLNGMQQQYPSFYNSPHHSIGMTPYQVPISALIPNGQQFLMSNPSLPAAHLINSVPHPQQIPYIHPHSVRVPQNTNSKLKDAPTTKQSPPSKRRRVPSHHGKSSEDVTRSHLLSKDLSTDYTRHSVVQEHQHVT